MKQLFVDMAGTLPQPSRVRKIARPPLLVLVAFGLAVAAADASAQSRTVFGTGYAGGSNGFTFTLGGIAGNNAVVSNANCALGGVTYLGEITPGATATNYPGTFYTPAPTLGVTPGIGALIDRDVLSQPGCVGPAVPSYRTTLNFSQAFDSGAVRVHFLNLDAGQYQYSPTAGLSIVRLSGNNEFEVSGTLINATPRVAFFDGCQANDGTNPSAGCGSIRLDTAPATLNQLIWDSIDSVSGPTGDGHLHFYSLTQPSLLIRKRTTGGTGATSFNFSYPSNVQSNAVPPTAATSETINVPANNTFVNGAARFIANSAQDTAITETVPANWAVSGTCYDVTAPNTALATIGTDGAVTLPAASVTPTMQIRCDFTNTRTHRVTLSKILAPATVPDRFNLQVNATAVATNVGNNGTGNNSAVAVGSAVTIAEVAGVPNGGMNGYTTGLQCTGAVVVAAADNRSATFTMPDADVACTFTNTQIVDLAITKTATPNGTYLPGQALNYGIVVTNNGTTPAVGVSVTDTVPANVTVTNWACTAAGASDCDNTAGGTGANGTTNTISLPNVTLGAGESLTIAVTGTAQLAATGDIVNTATATPPAGSTCTTQPCTRSSTTTNTNGGTPQLTIVKTATPASFAVGQPATYTLAVSNTGTSSTSGTISVNDPLPAGITATLPITAAGWNCAASTVLEVNCTSTTVLLPNSNAPVINVAVAVAATTANPAVNTATVQGGGDSTCPGAAHCTSTTNTPVNAPRLDVTKTLTGNLVVGVQATYTIQVTNGGTADTLAGTVSDTIPDGLAIDTVSAGCTVSGQVVTCAIAAGMSPGQSVSFTTQVTPQANASGQSMTNRAVASGGGDSTCPLADHCTGTTTDTVDAPQLSLVKTATPNPFVVGVASTYTLTLTNTGTAATTAATTISDTIPGGLTIGAMPVDCTLAGQVVTCTVAAPLATNTPVSFAIPVTPQASLNGLSVTNRAAATGGGDPGCPAGADPVTLPVRCIGTTTTNVNAPKLDIVKRAGGANFVVGVAGSYTLQVTNSGVVATTGDATVTDVVPADLAIDSAPGCAITGQAVTCTIPGPFAAGATTSFTIDVTPTAAASGQTLTNTATVQGGGDPTCPTATHCTSTTNTPVDAPQLTINKAAGTTTFVPGVASSYILRVTSTGSAATTAVSTVSDTVPSSLTPGTMPAGCGNSGQVVTCTIAAGLAVGANVSFVIPVTLTAAANGSTLVNTATVTGGGDPSCPADTTRCSSTTNTPTNAPQLTLVKTASAPNFVVGVPASYTLTVTNTGSAATTTATTIEDPVPAGLAIGAMPAGCTLDVRLVTCTVPAGFAAGASMSFVIPVTPTPEALSVTSIVNTATITTGDPACPQAGRCGSTVDVPVGDDSADLMLVKTDGNATAQPGQSILWTLTATNNGPNDAVNVSVGDPLPPGLDYAGATGEGWTCASSDRKVTCTRASLARGATATIRLQLMMPSGYAGPSPVVNTATVTSTSPDPNPSNNTGTDDTPVLKREIVPVPTLSPWMLVGVIIMLGGFGLFARASRRRTFYSEL